ncbi:MAG TPA: NrfD/PsrC family molybdoenzyme membrane anchor subunit [Gemmatimonadaceae bacterium]
MEQLPSTYFTTSPEWGWYITFYFFIGGIAGGSLFLGTLMQLFGRPEDRPIIGLSYIVAFVGAVISGILLILDLGRPERFWHMMLESETMQPMFKYWSPMSVGVWGLLLFGAFATLLAFGALYDSGRVRWGILRPLSHGPLGTILAILGATFGFFLAGYTGVLLAATNRPAWSDSPWLGVLFLFSAASTAAATLMLLGRRRGAPGTLAYLSNVDKAALVLELIALVVFLVTIGETIAIFFNLWGLLLVLGTVVAGILLPLAMGFGKVWRPRNRLVAVASLVLIGGFILRFTTIFASEQVESPSHVVEMP